MGTPTKAAVFPVRSRDLDILVELVQCRVASTNHLTEIFFEGGIDGARKRLAALKHAGLIEERPRNVNEVALLSVTAAGRALLRERGRTNGFPQKELPKRSEVSPLTLPHDLEVMNVKAAFYAARRKTPGIEILEFSTWPELHKFRGFDRSGYRKTGKPDGFIRLHRGETGATETFYLELDRSTKRLDHFASQAALYRSCYKSSFARKEREPRTNFEKHSFRVLAIFTSAERRNNVADKLLRLFPPILAQMWLSTLDEVKADAFGRIWIRPIDYRDALEGTRHDVWQSTEKERTRSFDRDALVEERVVKKPLFEISPSFSQQDQAPS